MFAADLCIGAPPMRPGRPIGPPPIWCWTPCTIAGSLVITFPIKVQLVFFHIISQYHRFDNNLCSAHDVLSQFHLWIWEVKFQHFLMLAVKKFTIKKLKKNTHTRTNFFDISSL